MEPYIRGGVMPTILIDGRCAGCGRLLMKFSPATEGDIQIKCWASRCKEINLFKVQTHQTHVVLMAT